jgi:hypothetical protein
MSIRRLFSLLAAIAVAQFALAVGSTTRATTTFNLDFSAIGGGGGILDKDGQDTGFTMRLSGTGDDLNQNADVNLDIDTGTGKLAITTGNGVGANQDLNGQAGLGTMEALGIQLSSLGYTGIEDFIVTATFDPLPSTEGFDQAGIFIAQDSANLTRAGFITFSAQEYFAGHTTAGADNNGRFFGFGFNGADGMDVTITRLNGDWHYFIDGLEWQPNSMGDGTGTPVDPTGANGSPDLDSLSDLTVGVFAANVVNTNSETIAIDDFRVIVNPPPGPCGTCGPEVFELISDHMFESVPPGTYGDITLDGVVDYSDFRLWKNYQNPLGGVAAAQAIPEPSSGMLLLLATLILTCRPK